MRHALLAWLLLATAAATAGCGGLTSRSADFDEMPARADRIYRGGPIVTLDANDRVAEALAVRGGRIAAVGSEDEVLTLQGPSTRVVDLAGHALLPGFIDAHGHLTMVALYASTVNLASPPVGPVGKLGDLEKALRREIDERELPPGSWVVGTGYDDALLAERRHPTRADLDRVSTAHPILVVHVSGHLAVANGRALEIAGIDAATPDPPGGVFRREAGSNEPNGVIEEQALRAVLARAPRPSGPEMLRALGEAQRSYASHGFTTAQDGGVDAASFGALLAAQEHGVLFLDVIAYGLSDDLPAVVEAAREPLGQYDGHLKLGGGKIVLDGSPQGKTAWLSEPYFVPPAGRDASYAGYPIYDDETVYEFASGLCDRGWPVLAHANGDAAAEQWIRTVERIERERGPLDWRPVMIHAQTLRPDQLPRVAKAGIIPSFFVSHTFYWGDWHRDSVLGPERAARISPAASAIANGVRFTIHNDAPVVPPDGIQLLWSAVNRITRSGQVLGPDERLTPVQALRALTIDAAYQSFEEAMKGSLEPGKLADLVILSRDPLEVEPEAIREIEVLQTIKAGKTIWRRKD